MRLLRRRPFDPGTAHPGDKRTGASWLAVTSGPPAAVTEVMTAFGADSDALWTGAPPEMVAQLLRITRTLPALLSRQRGADGMPEVTVRRERG